MIKPIIIATMLFSAAISQAEGSLTSKVTNIYGCAGELVGELTPERKAVLNAVKSLSAQIELLSKIKGKSYFTAEVGTSYEDLDVKLAQIARDTLEPKANALKSEDLLESLAELRKRVKGNEGDLQRAPDRDAQKVEAKTGTDSRRPEFYTSGSEVGGNRNPSYTGKLGYELREF